MVLILQSVVKGQVCAPEIDVQQRALRAIPPGMYGWATRQSRFGCLRRPFRIRIMVSAPSESSSAMRRDYAEYRDLL
jgi:hypothetical protein